MQGLNLTQLVVDLLVILGAGLFSGLLCKRYGVSLLVGYLIVGSILGKGGLRLVDVDSHELEILAEAGVLLLLFAVGIEFSVDEIMKLWRFFLMGGVVQLLLVAVPLTFAAHWAGLTWSGAMLAGAAGALSSTVLVFRALSELGQSASPHGRRAIGILLFQDVALIPLLLLVPLLTGKGEQPTVTTYLFLALKSTLFVTGVWGLQRLVVSGFVPLLAKLRSVELIVLFTLCLLGGVCWLANQLGLPPAVGALAAGMVLSGNRLSKQIDTIVLPFRETFAAVFFVTLGVLLQPLEFFKQPWLLIAGLVGIVVLKTAAATVAMRCVGLNWRSALGMGLGLSQLGEFSFLLVAEGVHNGIISPADYNRMLVIALGTLILTPQFLRWGLLWTTDQDGESPRKPRIESAASDKARGALVIGIGPIGRQIASRLETMGAEVRLLDLSPVNLYPFAQLGFATFSGDARDPEILKRAEIDECQLAVVCVPSDDVAAEIVASLRALERNLFIVVRCRYQSRIVQLEKAGANRVISEEAEASGALVRLCEESIEPTQH